MSYYDQLMGLSGLYYCASCGGFHSPLADSPAPPRRGGFGSAGGWENPTLPAPISRRGTSRGGRGFRDPWDGIDPYAGAREVDGPDDEYDYVPAYPQPSRAPSRRAPGRRPARGVKVRSKRRRGEFQDHDRYPRPSRSGGGATSGAGGGPIYNSPSIPPIPTLPPPDPRGRIRPKNPNETFLNPKLLRGADRHPFAREFPKRLRGGPTPIALLSAEAQSARAFIHTCMACMNWTSVAEDMYSMALSRRVPLKLVRHFKYLLAAVVPFLRREGELAPGDWGKVRRCLDWMAEVGECFGGAATWDEGFGKGGGHAREGGWWRKERLGFPEGQGFSEDMV